VWKVVGSAVTGTAHESSGGECEDSYGWRTTPDLLALAVADGAGSRSHSHLGSRSSIVAILDWAGCLGPDDTAPKLSDGVEYVRGELRGVAERAQCNFDSLATTLGVVLVRPETIEVGQVGDTIVVLQLIDGSYVRPSPPEAFEYVNETVFVTDDAAVDHLRVDSYPAETVQGIALSTDGLRFKILGNLATNEPFVPFFEDVFAYVGTEGSNDAAVGRFLSGLNDQSGDDKTLVIGVRDARVTRSKPDRLVLGPDRPDDQTTALNGHPTSTEVRRA
jgi:hypothetical protein